MTQRPRGTFFRCHLHCGDSNTPLASTRRRAFWSQSGVTNKQTLAMATGWTYKSPNRGRPRAMASQSIQISGLAQWCSKAVREAVVREPGWQVPLPSGSAAHPSRAERDGNVSAHVHSARRLAGASHLHPLQWSKRLARHASGSASSHVFLALRLTRRLNVGLMASGSGIRKTRVYPPSST